VQDVFAKRLAKYKLPKRVTIVEDLPRNAMGKVPKCFAREVWGPCSIRAWAIALESQLIDLDESAPVLVMPAKAHPRCKPVGVPCWALRDLDSDAAKNTLHKERLRKIRSVP
jgi:hypothetical protein